MIINLDIISKFSFKTSTTLVLLLLCVSTFSGCGKKGSLYLPYDSELLIETSDTVTDESKDSKKKSADQ